MSDLSSGDKKRLETYLEMGNGYVLDFTSKGFDDFFATELNINISDDKYIIDGRASKAKKLRAFWKSESNDIVAKSIEKLIEYNDTTIVCAGKSEDESALKLKRDIKKMIIRLQNGNDNEDEDSQIFLKHNYAVDITKLSIERSLQDVLSSRIEEMKICINNKAYLAAIILIGSTLEGLLIAIAEANAKDFNLAKNAPKDQNGKVLIFSQWTLSQLIDVAYHLHFLKEDVFKFAHSLRDFRNYIHPKQQQKMNFDPTTHTAQICFQVLLGAINSIEEVKNA